MLNRRLLRIKAFKYLYAYENCKEANYELAIEQIKSDFAQDLNSMEPFDKEQSLANIELATLAFKAKHQRDAQKVEAELSSEVEKAISDASDFYLNNSRKDFDKLHKELLNDYNVLADSYFRLLQLVIELSFLNKKITEDRQKRTSVTGVVTNTTMPLYHNKVVEKIKNHEFISSEIIKRNISWDNQIADLRHLYLQELCNDEIVGEYLKVEYPNYDQDWHVVDHLFRTVFFKNEFLETHFDSLDINWDENKSILRSLVIKTMKSAQNEDAAIEHADLSLNWEEDSLFLSELYKETIKQNDYLEDLIEKSSSNWDLERIALTDRVILKAALCEMRQFPSIPIKVTINEFIDISKKYSTPKSKSFVNGMLDVISDRLIKSGDILKSGRGLIDNN